MSAVIDKIYRPFFRDDVTLEFTPEHDAVIATHPNGAKLTLPMDGFKWSGSPTEPLQTVMQVSENGDVRLRKPNE